MVWLMMPTEFNGSLVLYRRVIRPFFLKHRGVIDDTVTNIKDNIKETGECAKSSALTKGLLTFVSVAVGKVAPSMKMD